MKKKEKLLRGMDGLDDRFLEEADPSTATIIQPKRKKIWKWSAVAACLCLVSVSLSLWLFLPFKKETPDVSEYESSEYYDIIQKISTLNANIIQTHTLSNNRFELLQNSISGLWKGESKDNAPEAMEPTEDMEINTSDRGESDATGTNGYVEVTDNQVEGVIEGDLFKRTKTRAFYLRESTLSVYSIEGEKSRLLGSYTIDPFFDEAGYYYYNRGEIFLSEDGNTVTLVCPYQINSRGGQVGVLSLDVSDPEKITEKAILSLSGGYLSSRSLDGKLLLVSEFAVGRNPDFSKEENFLPRITTNEGTYSVPAKDIISPETLTSSRYTVVCELDQVTLEPEGFSALLSYSQQIYVSRDSIYATRAYEETKDESENTTLSRQMTEISRLYFGGEGFELKGSVSVEGEIKDQYSMDEFEGMLRAVTTTSTLSVKKNRLSENGAEVLTVNRATTNANLYIIDLASMSVTKSVERFAPEGERVQSVRFDGTAAYVCTSVQLSDPVFFFDLSDLENITWKDTGTIEGFSSSLVNFGDGYLLGIGRGDNWSSVKLEIYEESADTVISVADYLVKSGTYSADYKSYLIDRENQIVGLSISFYENSYQNQFRYVLLQFDGYELNVLLNLPASSDLASSRAFIEDGYLYLFHANGFTVTPIQS